MPCTQEDRVPNLVTQATVLCRDIRSISEKAKESWSTAQGPDSYWDTCRSGLSLGGLVHEMGDSKALSHDLCHGVVSFLLY